MQTLQIGLSSWIIQDGNYDDFEVGGDYRFALEFYASDLVLDNAPVKARSLTPIGNGKYTGEGSVIYASHQAWVIDVGVPAYREERAPRAAKPGSRVTGEIYIGIDPFFYFERLEKLPGMPDLYRNWHIKRILLETTPWLDTIDETGRKLIARDESKTSFLDVMATDAWRHDNSRGHYVLECEPR